MIDARWTDKLTRPVRDAVANVTLHTRDDARRYIESSAKARDLNIQWHVAAKLLLENSEPEDVTRAIELALRYERRSDDK